MQKIFHPDNNYKKKKKKKKEKRFEMIVHPDKNKTKKMMEVKWILDLSKLIRKVKLHVKILS